MARYKNDRVVSVRLSAKAVKKLEDISESWDISVGSLVRSFVLSCLYSLSSSPSYWIGREQPNANKT